MSSLLDLQKHKNGLQAAEEEEEEADLFAMYLGSTVAFPMVLGAVLKLGLLEILSKANGRAPLSASQIASHLPTNNPDAPVIIDRILRLLASHSIVKTTLFVDDKGESHRLYSCAPVCKHLIKNEHGVSLASLLLASQHKVAMDPWYYLKESVLEGNSPFVRAHGIDVFEYAEKNKEQYQFYQAMYDLTFLTMKKILKMYNGFESLNEVVLVDVGGGLGSSIGLIVSHYPHIKGINFDLPHVVKDAPSYPGVKHEGGDMFTNIPKGDVIFMKSILHDWSDDHCLKILKNCYDSLPQNGKVILLEFMVPEFLKTDLNSKTVLQIDVSMYMINPGGRERTMKEFEALAKGAGFTRMELFCRAYNCWLMELYKS